MVLIFTGDSNMLLSMLMDLISPKVPFPLPHFTVLLNSDSGLCHVTHFNNRIKQSNNVPVLCFKRPCVFLHVLPYLCYHLKNMLGLVVGSKKMRDRVNHDQSTLSRPQMFEQ